MVLDAVARESGDAAVIHMDRTHGDRALRQNETVAFVVGNFQMVGDHVNNCPKPRRSATDSRV
jgi:hypothetical protein